MHYNEGAGAGFFVLCRFAHTVFLLTSFLRRLFFVSEVFRRAEREAREARDVPCGRDVFAGGER